ncbi:MAG: hypothetical protein IH594_09485, partial [Bacteroidales bacterium]|nr:hypothetical protein [Bacteroidales bacterium]
SVSISSGNAGTGNNSEHVHPDDRDRISRDLTRGNKVLILAGMRTYSKEEKFLLNSLSFYRQITVIAENITNLTSDFFISCPEIILGSLGEIEKKFLTPDLVISFGGQVVSKKVRLFVQGLKDVPVLALNTFPQQLFSDIPAGNEPTGENRYLKLWKSAEKIALEKAGKYLSEAPFANLTAVGKILKALPEDIKVHLGNSGTIRYSQLFPSNAELTYYSNRGTSGIDGCLSAAAGAAMVSDNLHVAILGDLSFVYDSNGLWNRNFPQNLKIIVLNDQGGGIFRIIEGPEKMPFFEEFSVAHHPVSIKLLTEAFGLKYFKASNYEELNQCLGTILEKDSGASVLEVETWNCENNSIFKKFYYSIKN